jgi:hypothetical protein
MTKPGEEYSDEEATRRMNEALRRALNTPPKPQKEMVGERGKTAKRRHPKQEVKGDR